MTVFYPSKKYQRFMKSMDKNLGATDPVYNICVVLLGMANAADTSSVAIADETELPLSVVRPIRARAKSSGIIAGKNKINANWNDPKDGGISFWMDVATVQGFVRRVRPAKANAA